MRPIAITGADGLTLEQAWADGPHGYKTVALAGFPNLFMVMGPHSPLVSISDPCQRRAASGLHRADLELLGRDGV